MEQAHSVRLAEFIREFDLEILFEGDGLENAMIYSEDLNRPGLQLTGFYDYFDNKRIQVLGIVENTYLKGMRPEERRTSFDMLLSKKIPALVIANGLDPYEECMERARFYGIPVLRTPDTTTFFIGSATITLKSFLAPRIVRHGVLVEVYGEGLLLTGESGVGKSETAIELVKRGHRLIADDAVEIRRVSSTELIGSAPELIRYYMELRGIGVIDVRKLFGIGAVKPSEKVDLVINLEQWDEGTKYDRLGADNQYMSILGVRVPCLTVPVKPGRNLAVVLEVAAMNNRQKKMGYNTASEFAEQINKHFDETLRSSED